MRDYQYKYIDIKYAYKKKGAPLMDIEAVYSKNSMLNTDGYKRTQLIII
jgi:hypothetical protein